MINIVVVIEPYFALQNLSQLASINHDVLIQSGKDSAKGSPARGPGT